MTRKGVIAYQGEPGANSHIACVENYPDLTPLACATFEDAFAALQDGSAFLGMIPIENSIAGRVADIHTLLPASGLNSRSRPVPPASRSVVSVNREDHRFRCAEQVSVSIEST